MRRHFVLRQTFPAPFLDLILGHRFAGLQYHPCFYRLAAIGVGDPCDADFQNLRVRLNRLFYLAGPNLISAGFDEFFLAVYDVEVAVFVHAGDVAGEEPYALLAVHLAERVRGFRRHVVVALHHLRSFDDEFPDFSQRDFGLAVVEADDFAVYIGEGHPDGAGFVFAEERVAVRRGRRFGKPVAFEDFAAREFLEFFFGLSQQRRGTGDAGFDGGKVVFPREDIGVVVDGVVERGDAGENGRVELARVFEQIFQIARVGNHHHRRAGRHRKIHPGDHAVDVEERNRHEDDFAAFFQRGNPRFDLQTVRHDISVQRDRAFRASRRAAGVLEEAGIIGGDFDLRAV